MHDYINGNTWSDHLWSHLVSHKHLCIRNYKSSGRDYWKWRTWCFTGHFYSKRQSPINHNMRYVCLSNRQSYWRQPCMMKSALFRLDYLWFCRIPLIAWARLKCREKFDMDYALILAYWSLSFRKRAFKDVAYICEPIASNKFWPILTDCKFIKFVYNHWDFRSKLWTFNEKSKYRESSFWKNILLWV